MSNSKNTFAIKISVNNGIICGNEPYREDNVAPDAILIVKQQGTVDNGEVVVGELNGELIVKRYFNSSGHILLTEPNTEPLVITDNDEFKIFGKAIEKRVSYL